MTEFKAQVKIDDPELLRIIMSTDPKVIENWLLEEFQKTFTEELKKHIDEEVEKILYGEGGRLTSVIPTSISLEDFTSMHPSMWVNYSRKPKNHYERMMRRRINS